MALGLSSYDTKKELDHAAGIHTSNLAAKKIAVKAGVAKLDINQLVNAQTSLNNLKSKVDDLDVGKRKTVCLKKLSDAVDNELLKIQNLTH